MPKANPLDVKLAAFAQYWEWDLLPMMVLASLRLWYKQHTEDPPQDLVAVLQPKRPGDNGNLYADLEVVRQGENARPLLRVEYKLTAIDPILRLKQSIVQVGEEAATAKDRLPLNVLIVVGAVDTARQSFSEKSVLEALVASGVEMDVQSKLTLEAPNGCFARGIKQYGSEEHKTTIEVIVCEAGEVSSFIALKLLGQSRSSSAVTFGRLLREILKSVFDGEEALPKVIEQKGSFSLWPLKGLHMSSDALRDLLLNPLHKLLRDFTWMSVTGDFTYRKSMRSLLKLSLIPTTSSQEAAINRMLSPMSLRIPRNPDTTVLEAVQSHDPWKISEPLRVVIESHAGTGKSTMVGFLKWLETERLHISRSLPEDPTIPLFLDLQNSDWSRYLLDLPASGSDALPDEMLLCLLQGDRPLEFKNADNVFSLKEGLPAFLALLSTWKIDLFIDGYDQLRDNRDRIEPLGRKLAEKNVMLRRLIITSRPGYQANALWQDALRFTDCNIRDPRLDHSGIESYVGAWFRVVHSIASVWYEGHFGAIEPEAAARNFINYLDSKDADKEFVKTIKSTPLLLTITLALFSKRAKNQGATLPPARITALFQDILMDDRLVDINEHQRTTTGDLSKLAALSFALLMGQDGVLGAFSNKSVVILDGKKTKIEDKEYRKMLDNASFLDGESETPDIHRWRYIHPSFQEYLACKYFVDKMVSRLNGTQTVPGPDQTPISPWKIVANNGFYGTLFSEVMTRMGDQALKFVLGNILLSNNRQDKLRLFLDCLSADFGLQQYLYDTECLKPALKELEDCLEQLDLLGDDKQNVCRKVLLKKLIGHLHYASSDSKTLELSFATLQEAIKLCERVSFPESRWFQLFCYDHIQNRAVDDRRKTNTKAFQALVEEVESPDSSDIRLRRAHFEGHLGNQVLRDLERADAPLPTNLLEVLKKGEAHYTAALRLRAVSFAECIASDALPVLRGACGRLLEVSEWVQAPAGVPVFDGTREAKLVERFSGPTQAIGDFANQLVGRAAIRYWMALEQRIRHENEGYWMKLAQKDHAAANELWSLANDEQIRRIRGERATKYVTYLPSLDARQEILQNFASDLNTVKKRLSEKMTLLAREYRVSLPSEKDTRDMTKQLDRFYRVVQSIGDPSGGGPDFLYPH